MKFAVIAALMFSVPGSSPTNQYYYATVDPNDITLAITPTVLDADYKSLTVNASLNAGVKTPSPS